MLNNEIKIIQREFRSTDEAKYIHRLHGVFLVLKGLSTVKAGELLNEPVSGGVKTDENRRFENPSGQMA